MHNVDYFSDMLQLSYIIINNSIVVEVSQQLMDLTEYPLEKLLNKNIIDIFKVLRVGPNINIENIDEMTNYFLFTKSLEVRFVNIEIVKQQDKEVFIFIEKPDSRLDDKLIFLEPLFKDNNIGCSIYSVPDLVLLKSNQKYLEFMEPPYNVMEKCIGTTLKDCIPEFEGSNSGKLFSTILQTGNPEYYNEFRYDHYSRGVTYWDGSVTPIFIDGKIKYIFQLASNVTERVINRILIEEQAETIKYQNAKLGQQNELMKRQSTLLDLSREAIFAWELDGSIIYWNKGAERMYGYRSDEAVGRISHDLLKTVHPGKFDDIKAALLREGIWKGALEHIEKDGNRIFIETSHQLIRDESGRKIVLETNRDITERLQVEIAERESRTKLEAALASMTDAVFISDAEGNFIETNDAFATFHKFRNKEECLKTLSEYPDVLDVFTDDGKLAPLDGWAVPRALRGETATNAEYMLRRKDTGETWIGSYSFGPIRDENGAIVGSVVTGRDITYQKQAEDDIKQLNKQLLQTNTMLEDLNAELEESNAELQETNAALEEEISEHQKTALELQESKTAAEVANKSKGQFLANMSHEIRTPMNGIIGMTDLLKLTYMTDEQTNMLSTIRYSSESLLRIINDILDLSKIDAGKVELSPEYTDLRKLTDDKYNLLRVTSENKGLDFEVEIGNDVLKEIIVDKIRLIQVINNLIGNAIKFTDKGKIGLSIKMIKTFGNKAELMFSVSDTGIGIKEEDIPKLFNYFTQLDNSYSKRFQGTGLGLAISKRLVELMGGEMFVESEYGKGSTFHFTCLVDIPEDKQEIRNAQTQQKITQTQHILNILLVEDDPVSQLILKHISKLKGWKINVASTGKEALDIFEKSQPDIILMDIQLPEMSGFDVTNVIREKEKMTGKHTPIIATTAYAMSHDKERCIEVGMDDYISKPIDIQKLYETIEKLTRK